MKLWTIVAIIAAIIIAVLVLAFASMAFIVFDMMSYSATGSETMSPAGDAVGKALVVYDPGVSGAAKNAATTIAADLKSKGYRVDLMGIRNPAAADVSGYDLIVVGGPIYVGNASSSVSAYLKTLDPPKDAKIGVFATGSVKPDDADPAALKKEVTSLPADSPIKVTACMKIISNADDVSKKCNIFVAGLSG
jgi:flavodoxin